MEFKNLQTDPKAFRNALLIDTDSGPRPFKDTIEPWQSADFSALDEGWLRAVQGSKKEAEWSRGWLERSRGHSKSLDLGISAAWALFASRRRLSGIAAAGDKDQARLLRDAIGKIVFVNPWLADLLEVQNDRVVNKATGSSLDIIASDAPTSYGLTPDFIVIDELTHWAKRDLWDSLISSAAKRSTCMLVIITNAGVTDSWQWELREAVRADKGWFFSRLNGPKARWITADRLAEQERLLPGVAYRRLWLNEWSSGGGDALREDDINRAFVEGLKPQVQAEPGFEYVAGLDLGVSRDSSALCVLGIRRGREGHGRIRLAFTRLWRPSKVRKVDLVEVEKAIRDAHDRFDIRQLSFDPWEARHLASTLQAGSVGTLAKQVDPAGLNMSRARPKRIKLPLVEVPPTGANLQRMASTVIETFNDSRVELFEEPDLKRDLLRLRVEERSSGFRLTSPRDETGHGDSASAFALALLAASDLAAKKRKGSIADVQRALDGLPPEGATGAEIFAGEWAAIERRFEADQAERARLGAREQSGEGDPLYVIHQLRSRF